MISLSPPPKWFVYQEPHNVTLFGIRVFAGVIKARILRSSWIRVGPKSNDKCLYKRQTRWHRGLWWRRQYEDWGRVWSDASTSQGMWRIVDNHQKLRERHEPWLVWLSELNTGLQTKGSLVWFPVRVQAWVVGQVPRRRSTRGNHTLMFLSLSLPSPLPKK